MKTAVYAGSFDPITDGHLHIIKKACDLFDGVVLVIAGNSQKKYTFDLEERKEMCEFSLANAHLPAIVHTCSDQYVVEYATKVLKAQYLVRGIRSVNDFQEEFDIYHVNRKIEKGIETIFLMPDIDLSPLRSSMVKGLVGYNNWWITIGDMVSDRVLRAFSRNCARDIFEDVFSYSLRGSLDDTFLEVNEKYFDKPYHNWIHILHCIQLVNEFSDDFKDKNSVIQSLILHDAVDFYAEDQWWNRLAISRNIQATDHSKDLDPSDFSKDAQLIHDIDLEVLSCDPIQYNFYMICIREEYSSLSNPEWVKGRSRFLESMLKKKKIYWTDEFSNREMLARDNMRNELDLLKIEHEDELILPVMGTLLDG